MRYEAIRLFVDRARLRLPDFALTRENAGAVARVCRKLDGIPLAVELATARMGSLAVEQVAQRLDASLDVLRGASWSAEARQQTLRATLDWSHNLLSEVEQELFRRLTVFAGGWALEAAEAMCSGGAIEQEDVLDLLGGLVDKSLVVARTSTGGEVRYRMLEPLRQYAGEKLEKSVEAQEVRGRHAAFFLALAEEAEPELAGPHQRAWLERLEGEHDNLREALSWVLERGRAGLALRLGAALWRFWYVRGYISEGVRWLERVLADSQPAARVKALEGMGWLTQFQGDSERAQATYEQMLGLSRGLGDKGNVATALNSLGTVAAYRGEHVRAMGSFEEALLRGQKLGAKPHIIETLEGMASLAGTLGEVTRAARLWGAAEAARAGTGIALSPGEREIHEAYLASTRARLGEAAWEEALGEGWAMSLEEAAEYALAKAEIDSSSTPVAGQTLVSEPTGELTRREKEIAALAAQGLTNRQISEELSISERTAGNHVARILSKLELKSRTQIGWATEPQQHTPHLD
jgi:DNA-binding CsgD family transcriptional regulator/tetratricopeptide (TPR) repeat protein